MHSDTDATSATKEGSGPSPTPDDTPKRRGFAALDPAVVREFGRRGGRAAHRSGRAHEFTREEAQAAGRKGKEASERSRKRRAEGNPPSTPTTPV